ncbi:MAG: phospho-sugar mutase [Clostridia bacterium]|nr:phospho-sugar mutase [Clostridia bacterium]
MRNDEYLFRYEEWKKNLTDEKLKYELFSLNAYDIKERFYRELSVGTGGLRGILGVGTACLNVYTVSKITAGIAVYMRKKGLTPKVAVSYDSRINSDLFARTAASVFASHGIMALITHELMPTPFLSYAVRSESCGMGVMITASHNPAEYNGYKVYGADGCQITDTVAGEIAAEISACGYFGNGGENFDAFLLDGSIRYVEENVEEGYLKSIKSRLTREIGNVSVTYTPLHGTGRRIIPKLLRERGAVSLRLVESQMSADGNFPTCPYPNPEKSEALKLGVETASKTDSDILVATDPDADRIGVAVRTEGGYVLLSGNETGTLLCDYVLSQLKENGKMPERPVVCKTIVTTDMIKEICNEYGAETVEVLTGFKYIGETVGKLEKENRLSDFVLGLEESYGYLVNPCVRDKDAVSASAVVCEMASYYKERGKTLVDVLRGLDEKYGLFESKLTAYSYPGASGAEKMKNLIDRLRCNAPERIGGERIVSVTDYLYDNTGLPKSNVLSFVTETGAKVIIRPSGTEPLVKAYLFTRGTADENAKRLFAFGRGVDALLKD